MVVQSCHGQRLVKKDIFIVQFQTGKYRHLLQEIYLPRCPIINGPKQIRCRKINLVANIAQLGFTVCYSRWSLLQSPLGKIPWFYINISQCLYFVILLFVLSLLQEYLLAYCSRNAVCIPACIVCKSSHLSFECFKNLKYARLNVIFIGKMEILKEFLGRYLCIANNNKKDYGTEEKKRNHICAKIILYQRRIIHFVLPWG